MAIKLIVGLQNPGSNYKQTRHNAGGWFAEQLAKSYTASFKVDKKLHSELANITLGGQACKILIPLVFMNQSGLSIRAVCQFYRIEPQEVLIAHDDLDLAPGRIKLKSGGGHGGHNGLRDIITQLGSANFYRLRVGIGHPGHKELVLNYVLGKPSEADRQAILEAIERAVVVMPEVVQGDNMGPVMSILNN